MKKKTWLPMAILLATAGCACIGGVEAPVVRGQHQPPEKRQALFCPKDECRVTVTVEEDCTVRVEPYYLVMAGRGHTTIVWTIEGGTFARNPIRWKQRAGESVFVPSGKSSETRVEFMNNRTIGLFNYAVTARRGDKTCPELDPTAINDMP
jgi:hypothetical protein